MKKSKVFLATGCLMVIIAIAFVAFALNHPEASFPWSNTVTYSLYLVYLILTVLMFAGFIFTKRK